MMRTVLVAAALLGAVATGGASGAGDPWRALYRPLHVPRLEAVASCPTSRVDRSVDFESFGIGPGVGPGPVYPVGLNVVDGTLALAPAANFGSRLWMGQKVLWFVHPEYHGRVLIRGRQLDGPYRVRFDRGTVPPRELRIGNESVAWSGQPNGSRGRPSYTRLRAPGCYGYQIDGTSFSRVVVFRAIRTRA
jgi:hypothetical protein